MKNLLEHDPSPYLQQHKNNPVHWKTWTKENLNLAKKNNKPILLSIGYASCHWCHVMAHESFEDKETAEIMNNNFINIKVDREERPDIDFIFQSSFQLFNQSSGGWPLTMFLDENGVPFSGGTYFPKESKHGLPSFKDVLKKVNEIYTKEREKIINQSNLIKDSLKLKKNPVLNQELEPILQSILINLDKDKGGFKGAPKFPNFNLYDTLIYFYNKNKKEEYLSYTKSLLKNICSKGIYDHIEGGICRYTVDENWMIPHFEKMLYDNAQFVSLLSSYCLINGDEYFLKKIIQTIEFLNEQFKNKKFNLLGSAFDADSDGKEGKYYVFSFDEIKNIKDIKEYFEIKPEGNWEGKIILEEKKLPTNEIINKLREIRSKRNKPFFDDKTQLDLNCLWIKALINAHNVLPKQGYIKLAENYFNSIEKKFGNSDPYHSYSKNLVFLEDYAFLINALINLYDVTLNIKYKLKGQELTRKCIEKFFSSELNIFRKNEKSLDDIFFKPIDISDHTIPNGNAIMLINLTKLGFYTEAKKLSESLHGYLNIYKNYMVSSIKALDFYKNISAGKKCDENGCKIE